MGVRLMKLIVFAGFLALAACGSGGEATDDVETVETVKPEAPVEETVELAEDIGPAPEEEPAMLEAGSYCYFHEDEVATEGVEIEVTEEGGISGTHYGTVHDEENAYYTAFETMLNSGTLDEDGNITFETITQVDGDTQSGEQTWSITPTLASMVDFEPAFPATECEGLVDRIWPPVEE